MGGIVQGKLSSRGTCLVGGCLSCHGIATMIIVFQTLCAFKKNTKISKSFNDKLNQVFLYHVSLLDTENNANLYRMST